MLVFVSFCSTPDRVEIHTSYGLGAWWCSRWTSDLRFRPRFIRFFCVSSMEDFDTAVKIVVVGNEQVGKTSLTTRYCKGAYSPGYRKTMGAKYSEQRGVHLSDDFPAVNMMIYDIGGQENRGKLLNGHLQGACAALLVYSSLDRNSFVDLKRWVSTIRDACGEIPIALVQTKVDLSEGVVVSEKEAEDFSTEVRFRLFRVSAAENINVDAPFKFVCSEFVRSGETFNEHASLRNISLPVEENDRTGRNVTVINGLHELGGGIEEEQGGCDEDMKRINMLEQKIYNIELNHHLQDKYKLGQPSRRRTGGKKERSCVVC